MPNTPKAPVMPSREVPAPAPIVEAKAPETNVALDLIQKMTPEQKQMFREALGIRDGTIKQKKRTFTNADARRMTAMYGDVYRPNGGGFKPSEAMVDKGPAFVEMKRQEWEDRQLNATSNDDRLEEMASTARM